MTVLNFFRRYCLLVILTIELLCASNVKWGGERWKENIGLDGKGYYAYLPAIFIYNDLSFSFHDSIEKKYSGPLTYYEYRVTTPNGVIDKYFAGTALAELPFFLIAHVITKITGGIADGYSFFYQLGISLAGIFYGFFGLFYLRKILIEYSFSDNIISIVLYAIAFGTQLFYYSVFEPSMSHVYSFALITLFIFLLKRFTKNPDKNKIILPGFLLGWITLIRPVNFLIILILPFISGDKEIFYRTLKNIFRKNSGIAIALFVFLFTISIQGIFYFIQSGKIINDSYVVEHFIWSRLEIINILFSYKKGLFVYTPLLFISMTGLISIYRKSNFSFWTFIAFFLLITYVLSSWWNWWYGGSFGARPFVEYYSLFGLLLAYTILSVKRKTGKILAGVLITFCLILCQVQTYQFRYFIIHWDKMDKKHYWNVFMRIDQLIRQENGNADLLE